MKCDFTNPTSSRSGQMLAWGMLRFLDSSRWTWHCSPSAELFPVTPGLQLSRNSFCRGSAPSPPSLTGFHQSQKVPRWFPKGQQLLPDVQNLGMRFWTVVFGHKLHWGAEWGGLVQTELLHGAVTEGLSSFWGRGCGFEKLGHCCSQGCLTCTNLSFPTCCK